MKILANQNGFTYILALTVIMIMGIMLGMVGQSWKTIKQRELEEELIFRGDQVAELIYQKLRYEGAKLDQNTSLFLWSIDNSPKGIINDLVTGIDKTYSTRPPKKYRLRPSAALDPMTNKPWKIVTPVGDTNRFAGVRSESTEKPFRQSFKAIYDSELLDKKEKYSDWIFTWELKNPAPQIVRTGP